MRRNEEYLRDMLVAAREVSRLAQHLSYEQFAGGDDRQRIILKELIVVGEAAAKVDKDTKKAHTDIPWKRIVDFRNRLVHAYFAVNLKKVWNIVNEEIPALIARLERIVPQEERRQQGRPTEN